MLSPKTKFQRAFTLFEQLERETDHWRKNHQIEASMGRNNERTEFVVNIVMKNEPQLLAWAVLTGDILHNLRCVLDHIVYELTDSGTRTKPAAVRQLQFPVCATAEAFKKAVDRGYLAGVDSARVAAIREVQPFVTNANNLRDSKIYVLNELNNMDKHRHLHLSVLTLGDGRGMWRFRSPQCKISFYANESPLKTKDWIFGLRSSAPLESDPTMTGVFALRFVLSEPGYGKFGVIELLRALLGGVAKVGEHVTGGSLGI